MANPLRYYSLLLRCYCTDSQTTRARGGLSIPQQTPHAFPCMCTVHPVYHLLFERSEFLIATSKKKSLCVRSTNLGFSGGSANRYCCSYYVPDMYAPHFMIPGTYYVPDTYDTRYVLCTRYVCTTLAVVLLIVQLYRYLFIR